MLFCCGEEILTELLWRLGFPSESILRRSITIPGVLPRKTASLLLRNSADRPKVIPPENMTNLAVIGQFVEIPDEHGFQCVRSPISCEPTDASP